MNKLLKSGNTALAILVSFTLAQAQTADTIVVRVGKESKVTFSIKDKQDLETLKHYNFQALMDDMLHKLETRDTSISGKAPVEYLKDTIKTTAVLEPTDTWVRDQDRDDDYNDRRERRNRKYSRRTYHSFNIDLGMNNYLENGKFPDRDDQLYTVKPWGSWYVGLKFNFTYQNLGQIFYRMGCRRYMV